jgi:hypothetical protein
MRTQHIHVSISADCCMAVCMLPLLLWSNALQANAATDRMSAEWPDRGARATSCLHKTVPVTRCLLL